MKGEDARFAHLKKDPRFKKVGKDKRKVKIDNRFKHMFTAPEFSSVDFMDKRGRKEKQVTKEKLEKFYEMSSEDESETEEKQESTKPASPSSDPAESREKNLAVPKGSPTDPNEDESESETEDPNEEEEEEMSDSSDGEDSEEEEEVSAEAALDAWDEVNTCTETTSESTPRLSICNLNWDRMNATDIFVLCNSALNEKSGSIKQVEIFPSQYGKAQIAKESEKGPEIGPAGDEENDNGKEYSTEALRKYQIERLKYYYAIVTCDCVSTADILYAELDGVEYQLSSSVLDLRFVPDDMEFDDDPPSSACYSMPDMTTYKPPTFITTALQNSSVRLTWDETPQSRLQLTTKKFSAADLETVDFSAYIASSESESEGEEEGGPSLEKYKALLAGIEEGEEDEVDQEMEITWTTGLEDNKEVVDEAEKNEERQENSTFYAPDDKDDFFATDTVIDRPKKKKKKKKQKGEENQLTKEESELALLMESEKDDKKHFNMKNIVKSKKEDDFKVDIEDERFSAFKTSHHFAIDPSAPEYKSTSETEKLRAAQAAAMTTELKTSTEDSADAKTNVIDKIKSRTAQFQNKKENSKLFKTKNKGIPTVVENVSKTDNSDSSLKVKKKKKKKNTEVEVIQTEINSKNSETFQSTDNATADGLKVKKKKKKNSENVPLNEPSNNVDTKKMKKKKRKADDQSDENSSKHKKKKGNITSVL